MPRRNTPRGRSRPGRRPPEDAPPLGLSGERREPWGETDYSVRDVAGAAAVKTYRCPGCDHEIRPGVAHVVAWATGDHEASDRRHWHTGCWSGRARRSPTRRWS